jgi:hypothetical protein
MTPNRLVKNYDSIARVEDLNIKGLARSRPSKSILDAARNRTKTERSLKYSIGTVSPVKYRKTRV